MSFLLDPGAPTIPGYRAELLGPRGEPRTRHDDPRRGGRRGDERSVLRAQLAGKERDRAAARDDAPVRDQRAGSGRAHEVDLELERRRKLIGLERRVERGTERIVEHRGEESALHDADRIRELGTRREAHADRPLRLVDLEQLEAEQRRGGRRWAPALHDVPEVSLAHVVPRSARRIQWRGRRERGDVMHRSRLTNVVIDCADADYERAAEFWSAALGRPLLTRNERFCSLRGRTGGEGSPYVGL